MKEAVTTSQFPNNKKRVGVPGWNEDPKKKKKKKKKKKRIMAKKRGKK